MDLTVAMSMGGLQCSGGLNEYDRRRGDAELVVKSIQNELQNTKRDRLVLTCDTQITMLPCHGLLGLQLCLDNVERACSDAGDETAPRASCDAESHPRRDSNAVPRWFG